MSNFPIEAKGDWDQYEELWFLKNLEFFLLHTG